MSFLWPYYSLVGSKLYVPTRRGMKLAFDNAPAFTDVAAAEAWLEANDFRGNVREGSTL